MAIIVLLTSTFAARCCASKDPSLQQQLQSIHGPSDHMRARYIDVSNNGRCNRLFINRMLVLISHISNCSSFQTCALTIVRFDGCSQVSLALGKQGAIALWQDVYFIIWFPLSCQHS